MPLMWSKVYDAFIAGGTPPDRAQAASEELASYYTWLGGMDTRLAVLTWMVGANIAIASTMLFLMVRAH
jgi:hypothetical protein